MRSATRLMFTLALASCGWASPWPSAELAPPPGMNEGDGIVANEPNLGVVADPAIPAPYVRSIDLIQRLYMYPERISPEILLHAAATGLERGVDWLYADIDGPTVRLRHGDGRALGSVTITGWDDLPAALYGMERTVRDAGHPWGNLDLRLTILSGMTTRLDPYSRMLAGDKLDSFDTRLKGTLVGIGATLLRQEDRIVISAIQEGGPAEKAGVLSGDVLLKIDGLSTLNLPVREAVRHIRGQANTSVRLTLQRGEAQLELDLNREQVVVENVTHEVLAGGIGYVRIDNVSQQTVHNLTRAMSDLSANGALETGLVLDLRGNSGGSMKESAAVVDQFVKGGVVLTTGGRDGQSVTDLLARLDADDDLSEPQIPLVILVDPKTASGAEIISGSLQQMGRAALVGQRTFGKGQVQKVYTLEAGLSFKLTVAEYEVTNNTPVVGVGVQPEVHVGHIVVNADAVRVDGWDTAREKVAWDDIVPAVTITTDPGHPEFEPPAPLDVVQEIARRALLNTQAADRDGMRDALDKAAAEVRMEQAMLLSRAMSVRGVEWMAEPARGGGLGAPVANVQVTTESVKGEPDIRLVRMVARNDGQEALHRAWVQLDCGTFSPWDDLVFPLGQLPPGETREVTARVELAPGILERADAVEVMVFADQRPPATLPDVVLHTATSADPNLRVTAHVELGENDEYTAIVTLTNRSDQPLTGVEAWFEAPTDPKLELIEAAARAETLGPRASTTMRLRLHRAEGGPFVLPMQLTVEADRYGTLFTPELPLPVDGTEVVREAPQIQIGKHPSQAPAGRYTIPFDITDDGRLEDIVLFHNGEKMLWHDGGAARQKVQLVFDLAPGVNTIVAAATDETGTRTQLTWRVFGDAAPIEPVELKKGGGDGAPERNEAADDGRSWAPRSRGRRGQDG